MDIEVGAESGKGTQLNEVLGVGRSGCVGGGRGRSCCKANSRPLEYKQCEYDRKGVSSGHKLHLVLNIIFAVISVQYF